MVKYINRQYSKMRLVVFFLVFVVGIVPVIANSVCVNDSVKEIIDRRIAKIDNRSRFVVSTGYLTKISYAGRYYGIGGIGLYPTLVYKHKSGIETSLSGYVWTGYTPLLAQSVFDISYSKDITSWVGVGIGYSRSFMFYGTDSDKRAMNNSINLNLGLYLPWMNLGVEYGYMFGYDKASGLHVGANRDFPVYKFLGSDVFTITPSAGAFWGPQSILYYYFSKKQVVKVNNGNGKGKGKGSVTPTTSTSETLTEPGTKFQSLAYQLSLSVTYRINRVSFEIGYKMDIPLNLPVDYEYGKSPLSYVAGSLKYTF